MRKPVQVSNSIGDVGGMFGPESEAVDRLDPRETRIMGCHNTCFSLAKKIVV